MDILLTFLESIQKSPNLVYSHAYKCSNITTFTFSNVNVYQSSIKLFGNKIDDSHIKCEILARVSRFKNTKETTLLFDGNLAIDHFLQILEENSIYGEKFTSYIIETCPIKEKCELYYLDFMESILFALSGSNFEKFKITIKDSIYDKELIIEGFNEIEKVIDKKLLKKDRCTIF